MDERVEEIRRKWEDKGWWTPGHVKCHRAIADLFTALAQAERERAIQHTCTKCGYITSTQYGEGLRAEVERLKGEENWDGEVERLRAIRDSLQADLAHVRAALETSVAIMESILSEDRLYMEWVRASIVEARAAVEGR